jgi:hypothetical protein
MKILAKPIEVVASFNLKGELRPIKFRIENEDKSFSVVNVDRVLTRDIEKLAGNHMLVVKCQSVINGEARIYELKYELGTMKWMLFKM